MKQLIKKMNAPLRHPLFLFLLCCVVLYLCYVGFLPHEDTSFDNEACVKFTHGWTYLAKDGTKKTVDLPIELSPNIPDGIRLTNTLPEISDSSVSRLAKFCIFQECRIYIDQKLFYDTRSSLSDQRHYDKARGPHWAFVTLPAHFSGHQITMEITSPYKDYQGSAGTILLGAKSAIIYYLIHDCFVRLLAAILFIVTGVVFIISSLIQFRNLSVRNPLMFLGWFLFWGGLWVFSESYLTQLILSSDTLANTLAFVSLRMLVISFLEYIRCNKNMHGRRLVSYAVYLLYAEAFVAAFLQLFSIWDFYQEIPIHMALVISSLLFLLIEMLVEVFRYKNESMHYMLYCSFILELAGLIEIINFLFITKVLLGKIFIFAAILCVCIIIIKELRNAKQTVKLAQEATYYEQLATVDVMTGCHNRVLMLQELSQMNHSGDLTAQTAAVVCDVNNLKRINDHYGHHFGDTAIQLTASLLMKSFSAYGSCYRTGGDEFICLLTKISSDQLQAVIAEFLTSCRSHNQNLSFPYSASIGYAFYDADLDQNVESMIHRADQSMYRMKQDIKRQEKNEKGNS